MNWKILLSDKPLMKCGVDPTTMLATSLIGGVSSVGSSIIANQSSAANVDKQLMAQQLENIKNRSWQTRQAEIAREFTTSEREAQQAYQTSEREAASAENLRQAERMAELNAYYNSPAYQVQELQKAGINPSVYFGRQSSFGGSNQSSQGSPFGSAPSGVPAQGVGAVAGLSPVSYQPLDLQIPALQQGFASLIHAGTQANVGNAQIEELLSRAIANEKDAKYKDALTAVQRDLHSLNQSTLPANIKKAFLEVGVLKMQKMMMEKEGKKFDSEVLLNRSQERLNNALEKLQGEKAIEAHIINMHLDDTIETMNNLNRAKASEARAAASLSSEQAMTESQLRTFRVGIAALDTLIKDNEREYNVQSLQPRLERVKEELGLVRLNVALLEVEKRDKDAYTTLQRLFFGKGDVHGRDARKAIQVLQALDDKVFLAP